MSDDKVTAAEGALAVDRLAAVNDNVVILHGAGAITEQVRDHILVLVQSKRDDRPHPESGLPCWCGDTHAVRRVDGDRVYGDGDAGGGA